MSAVTGDVDVVVVGGGIGGLAGAYALSLAGRRVRVLERAAAFRDRDHHAAAAHGRGGTRRRRPALHPAGPAEPRRTGLLGVRGLDADRAAALDDVTVWFALGCHLVQYPLRGGGLLNQVAVFASRRGRGASTWGTPDELDAAFAGTCAQVRGALGDLWRDRWWPMYDRAPISRWVDGRLALTGDAAHPMLQYLAQGACQALEDAHVLAEQVAKGGDGGEPDWDRALRAYQELREPRTTRIQRTVHVWGDMWHCDGLTRTLRNALFGDRDPADHRHITWLWGG